MKLFKVIFFLFISCFSFNSFAAKAPSDSWTFTLRFENDLFAATDQFYTNGIKLNWISPDLNWFRELSWLRKERTIQNGIDGVLQHLPYSEDKSRQRHVSLSAGQMMYTPGDIKTRTLIPNDRPYAGWLYASAAFHTKTFSKLDTFEIVAGFTGKWSLAEQAQDFIHSLRGIDKANGWDNQIDTELGIALIYDHKHRYIPQPEFSEHWGMDVITDYGGAVGNAFTHLNAGFEIRAGWNLPADFGTALIRPAGDTSAPANRKDPRYQNEIKSFSFHLFASATGRLVIRDIFLDGNTFSHSHSIDKKNLVGDFVIGASLSYRRVKISYAHVLRTREFEGQPDPQQFGSVSISYTY